MSISKEEVKHIAELSKLSFEDNELENLTEKLSNILDMSNQLASLDIEGVKPKAHILDIKNVFREDIIKPSCSREDILKNAPEIESGCFSVPQTID